MFQKFRFIKTSSFAGKKLLRTGLKYSVASTMSSISTMIVGFLNMRWLGPELLGIWQSLLVINAYLPFMQLGIQSGLNLELPILLGKEDNSELRKIVGTAKFFALMLSLLFFVIGLVLLAYFINKGTDIKIIYGVLTIVILAICSCFKLHFIASYRAASAFDKLTVIYIIDTIVSFLLVYFIYKYQYYGLLVFNAVKEIIHAILLYIYSPYRKMSLTYNAKSFTTLLKRGIFMTAHNQIKGVIDSFPKLLLLTFGGVIQVGLFTPALSVGRLMNMIPVQIAQFVQPQMGYKYGATGNAKDMWKYLKRISYYMPLLILPFSVMGWFLIPFVLDYFFPKYSDSLWPIRIMFIGFLFSFNLTRGFLATIKAYRYVFFLQGIDALCLLVLPYILIKVQLYSITIDMAIGLSIGFFVSYTINYFVVKHVVHLEKYNLSHSSVKGDM